MKRFFCFVMFLLSIFVFVSSLAETDEKEFVGVWFFNNYSNQNTADIELIAIRENHKAYLINSTFYDGQGQDKYDQMNCSWKSEGNKIIITHVGRKIRELYLFGNRYLSLFDDGRYENYQLVDDTALIAVLPSSEKENPPIEYNDLFGKWSLYFDATKLIPEYHDALGYDLLSYDLYLFDDGSVYLTSMMKAKDETKPNFYSDALSGIWIGDQNDMTLLINNISYKAKISEDGHLLFYMVKSIPFVMTKVDSTDFMIDQM